MARNKSVLEFGTRFIKLTAELDGGGLPTTPEEKYMSYIKKVGVRMGEAIRLDRRKGKTKVTGGPRGCRRHGKKPMLW